ncbi:MAG: peptidoglycan-binding protein [Ilumatobacter sp.]|uniref:peptidoglycan-binding protein n=1 Tax=Ilumatobacter sp. TaxID=1967498 RepID=UPI00260A4013|nr:peptidoglycan-binding protein [Ilumatobacter sp.]MDJ0771003.1 peptidoglycan-binding protein [Ilumatobacter sp.]
MSATRRHRVAISALVLASLAAGTAVAATVSIDRAAGEPTQPAERVNPPDAAVVIGDSAIAALRWVPGADNAIIGFEHTLDLESCRRLVASSCRGREGRVPPTAYEAMDFHAGKYKTLIIATGYNDGTPAFDQSFRSIVARARNDGYDRVLWWTLRSDVDYVSPGSVGNHRTFAQNNEVLRTLVASGAYPDVELADWGGYTSDRQEWFATDGVHYRAVGAWAASDYLSRKMAFLEDRPCPMPRSPGLAPENPCPDPDATGPVADIEALYPIGEDGVLCYEIGAERRFECRLDTHVLQLERTLRNGDSGPDVSALQIRLIRLGLLGVDATGFFGSVTETAVRSFQSSSALPVTGVADVATLDALGFDTSGIG